MGALGLPSIDFLSFLCENVAQKGVANGDLLGSLGSFLGHLGPHLEDLGSEMRCPRVPKSDFRDIMKTLISLMFFLGFWRSGLPLELQMDALGAYGRHFWPSVGYVVSLFGKFVRIIDF